MPKAPSEVAVTGKTEPLTQDQYSRLVQRLRTFVSVTNATATQQRKSAMLGEQARNALELLVELGEDIGV